jgi:hypothetical protein
VTTTINGLPAHTLLVHAVVVLVPLAAVLLVLVGLWPPARQRLSLLTAVLAGLALISVPLTTSAGEWLEHHLPRTSLIHAHAELGDTMLPWAIALFAVAAAVAAREIPRARSAATRTGGDSLGAALAPELARRSEADGPGGRPLSVALAVLALVVAAGSVLTVYRIGDSGARAAWTGRFSPTPIAVHDQRHDD